MAQEEMEFMFYYSVNKYTPNHQMLCLNQTVFFFFYLRFKLFLHKYTITRGEEIIEQNKYIPLQFEG